MTPMDRLTALAQIWLAAMFIACTFAVTLIYELGLAKLTAEQSSFFAGHVSWMQGACLIILYFFFQRQRPTATADPATTAISTTTTMTPVPAAPGGPSNVPSLAPSVAVPATPDVPAAPADTRAAGSGLS